MPFSLNGTSLDSIFLKKDQYSAYIPVSGMYVVGNNFNGQLGFGNTDIVTSPVLNSRFDTQSADFFKNGEGLIADIDGGYNLYSAGKPFYITRLMQLDTATNWKTVATSVFNSASHAAAIKTDGTLWTWGHGWPGQLGNGTGNKSTPTQVGTLSNWLSVSCGYRFTAAIKTDGTLWTCGSNSYGELGLNTNTSFYTGNGSLAQVGTASNWSLVSCSRNFLGQYSAAIKADGTLWTWGNNTNGQLGLGDTTKRSSIAQVGSLTNWSTVAVGYNHTVAIKTDGTLWSWGLNYHGQLGLSDTTNRSSPVQVDVLTDWSSVAAGGSQQMLGAGHTVAIKTDGTLWACGYNLYGQLGLSDTTNRSSFVQVGTLTDWKSVVCGEYNTAAIKTDGTLWAWGSGYLGIGDTSYRSSPVQVGSGNNWESVAAGGAVSFATKTNGTMWACGVNTQMPAPPYLGIQYFNAITVSRSPFPVNYFKRVSATGVGVVIQNTDDTVSTFGVDMDLTSSGKTWRSFDTGPAHFIGVDTSGALWTAGENQFGQLGTGDTTSRYSLAQVGSLTSWETTVAGTGCSFAINTDKKAYAFGANSVGKLGLADTGHRSVPTLVGAEYFTNVAYISGGDRTTAAIKIDGTLWACGHNFFGQLGLGDTTDRSSPVQVGALTNWSRVAGGQYHTAAIKTDGTLWTWGYNASGELGLSDTTNRSSPVQVGTLTNWSEVAGGGEYTAAIKTDGTLWSWGSNINGQLGLNDTTNRSSPVQVGTLSNWSTVAAGQLHAAAIKTDGTLWTWGYNFYGQLGLGNAINCSSPVQVGTLSNWSTVAAGQLHTAAIKTDGTLWCWGLNGQGQLGLSNMTDRSSPVQIGSAPYTWKTLSSGELHTVGVQTDGSLWSWGANTYGQLGTSNSSDYSKPTRVGVLTNWNMVACGKQHTLAIKTDGTLWSWGRNNYRQLGFNDLTTRSSPVQVGTLNSYVNIHACGYSSMFIVK
jgi:alpha-tubulin suppressor-like RCC1 family protein